MTIIKKIAYLLFVFSLVPFLSYSQEESKKEESKNSLALFIGGTSNESTSAFTVGLDYQYRINKLIGVGALIDYATADINSLLVAPALYLHVSNFEFTIAPALEISKDEDPVGVFRLGAAYEFEFKKFSLSPAVFWDLERNGEPAIVYGLSLDFDL